MLIVIELFLIIFLGLICFQDIKERKVSIWILFLGLVVGGYINYTYQHPIVFLSNTIINCVFVVTVFLILWVYAKLKMKKNIFEVFGKGDLFFFMLLAVSLPILSFLMVFIFSIIFALLVFILLKNRIKEKTVPLAGLQALFFGLVLIANNFVPSLNIYAL
ncbi:prepilin peptidase [Polaribacter vadi]|uniref:prepilin peptidase n=1 Tax=Polaribacter vadi TaxID=1774273 RepID=UPI0030EF8DC2|tara:strand:- start:54980 stop:55462 length:483 start_codon:yes stop_codon:yes gene_type:complete